MAQVVLVFMTLAQVTLGLHDYGPGDNVVDSGRRTCIENEARPMTNEYNKAPELSSAV